MYDEYRTGIRNGREFGLMFGGQRREKLGGQLHILFFNREANVNWTG